MITTWKADDGSIFFADGTWIRVGDRLKAEVVVSKHAAEVEARDEVITKLLAMLKDNEPGRIHGVMYYTDAQNKQAELYNRACEIAGRTE